MHLWHGFNAPFTSFHIHSFSDLVSWQHMSRNTTALYRYQLVEVLCFSGSHSLTWAYIPSGDKSSILKGHYSYTNCCMWLTAPRMGLESHYKLIGSHTVSLLPGSLSQKVPMCCLQVQVCVSRRHWREAGSGRACGQQVSVGSKPWQFLISLFWKCTPLRPRKCLCYVPGVDTTVSTVMCKLHLINYVLLWCHCVCWYWNLCVWNIRYCIDYSQASLTTMETSARMHDMVYTNCIKILCSCLHFYIELIHHHHGCHKNLN